MQLTVACVNRGDRYGPEYVNNLRAMVAKNLSLPHRFVCLTNRPEGLRSDIETVPIPEIPHMPENAPGWWCKLALFKPGFFQGRVLYLDLDVVITDWIDKIAETPGIIRDWDHSKYNSSVICWDAGMLDCVWERITPDLFKREPRVGNWWSDQEWIAACVEFPTFPESWCRSYRLHARLWPPAGCKVVCFHGRTKPHDAPSEWVRLLWSEEGISTVEFQATINTARKARLAQVEANAKRALPWQRAGKAHRRRAILVGGGPSLARSIPMLRDAQGDVFSLNGAHDYLIERGIVPHGMVLLDARPENACFVQQPHPDVTYYIAAVCHGDVLRALSDHRVVLWCADEEGVDRLAPDGARLIRGGPTVGLKTMCLVFDMGYREIDLFGLDSSYEADADHAYAQPMNGKDVPQSVWAGGRRFVSAPWMIQQARDFQTQAKALMSLGCGITVHGDGLLPHVARQMTIGATL